MKWLSLIVFAALSSFGFAAEKDHKSAAKAEKDYKICTVGGYYSGTDDKFLRTAQRRLAPAGSALRLNQGSEVRSISVSSSGKHRPWNDSTSSSEPRSHFS